MLCITGAAGFIGSNLAHRLAGLGAELLLVDHPLTPEKAANLAGLPERFAVRRHDAFLAELADGAWRNLRAIFHLGACSRTTETNAEYLRTNNVEYTQALWRWCARAERPFYYASSAATYGDGSLGFDDRTPPSRLRPLNLYGRSKNDFDAWALAEVAEGRPCPPAWAGLKFFNVYGPREAHKVGMHSVVLKAYREMLAEGEAVLFASDRAGLTDGGQQRDFVFVEDCIDHLLWLWRHPSVSGVFNSGTGSARSFAELATAVFAAAGRAPKIRYVPMPASLAGQYQNFTQADMSRLRGVGCDQPPTPLEVGVRRYVNWLLARDWARAV